MNDLDSLRRTLDAHSHSVHAGLDDVTRAGQLKERIAMQNRRRNATRAGLAVAAVAAVAGAVLVPTLGNDDEAKPADRTLLGQEAPASLTAPDHTYRFAQGWDDADASSLKVSISPADHARVLTWTTAGEDQDVKVSVPDSQVWDSTQGDFDDWVAIPAHFAGTVEVTSNTGTAGVGAALYQADPTALPDVVEAFHGQYFRADGPLLRRIAVAEGERGQIDLRIPFTDAGPAVRVFFSCEGLPAGLAINVDTDGAGIMDESAVCQGEGPDGIETLTKDLGLEEGSGSVALPTGENVPDGEARVWVSRSFADDTPVDPADYPDARLIAGVYSLHSGEEPLSGTDATVAQTEWAEGHRWELTEIVRDTEGKEVDVSRYSKESPVLAVVYTTAGQDDTNVTLTSFADGASLGDRNNIGLDGDGSTWGPVLVPRDTKTFESRARPMNRGSDAGVVQNLALYRLVR